MIFKMDDRAKSWIESKGKHLTVNSVEVKGCCAVGIQDLLAIPKKPKDLNRYNEFKIDNLSIYIQKNIKVPDKISLKISGVGFFKGISAKLTS
ncbi:CC/Se motif family (seleno)protein [Peribacillus sp. Hz7]|uniref:CC/Se motif family (seleno)protein n=1 Tax=Peribacillus sp. Hz7 TaxID=3344873 RepID=UPI0035CC27D3